MDKLKQCSVFSMTTSEGEGDHNISCDHEVEKDQIGTSRHYLVLRACVEVPQDAELLLPCCDRRALGMPGVALEACEARPPKPYTSGPFDFVDGKLPYSSRVEVKYSKLHGNGVYARKALQKGEIAEFAPSVLLMNTEMGSLLSDYRYSAETLREGLFRVVLGCGSIYNHSAEPNLGYRRVRVDASSEAVQGLSVCYYAKRDIAAGEELLISYGKTWWSSRGIHDATAAPQIQLLLPSSSVAGASRKHSLLPDVMTDALLDVLKVSVSRRNARKLFRQLAALPKKPSAIGSVGTTAQLTQLGKTSLDDSRVLSPGRPVAQTARSQPEKGLSRSKSEGRTVPKTTRVEVGVAKRPSMGVHLQEQIRQHWQSGLRDSESPARLESNDPRPELSNVSSRRSSVKTSPPPSNQNSANPLPMPGTVNRRSYEVWRRDVSLKSLLAFEAEVKARQESSTTSSEDDVRDLPGSSRSSKLPSDSPPSSRLRRSSEEERLEALPARFSEVDR
eukprot:symbB.v1.2.001368.t1/scaffold71.1/size352893/11